jgi:hypothetical protein
VNAPSTSSLPSPESIRFPALTSSQGLIHVINSLEAISQCTRLGFKSGYFKNLLLIDSSGNRFQIVGAKKVRTVFNFNFGELLGLVTGNPRWQVDPIFAPGSTRISLAEVKNLIADSFEREKGSWEEMSDFEEFEKKIEQAESLDQVFAVFKRSNRA